MGFRWSVKISQRIGLLEEQDGAGVGMCFSGPASDQLSILNAHFGL